MERNHWSLRYNIEPTSVFKWVRQWIIFLAIWISPTSSQINVYRSALILYSHLNLGLPSVFFFPNKPRTNNSSLPCMLHSSPNSSPHRRMSPFCNQFLAVQPKYSPQFPLTRHPQSISFPPQETSTERHTNSAFCIFYSFGSYISDGMPRDSEVSGKEECLKKTSIIIASA
jgi:hypothetical protein